MAASLRTLVGLAAIAVPTVLAADPAAAQYGSMPSISMPPSTPVPSAPVVTPRPTPPVITRPTITPPTMTPHVAPSRPVIPHLPSVTTGVRPGTHPRIDMPPQAGGCVGGRIVTSGPHRGQCVRVQRTVTTRVREVPPTVVVRTAPGVGGPPPPPRRVAAPTSPPPAAPPPGARAPAAPPPQLVLPAGERRIVPNEVLVVLAGALSPFTLDDIERRLRLTRLAAHPLDLLGVTLFRYRLAPGARLPDVLAALSRDGRVAAAQPNFVFATPPAAFRTASAGSQATTLDPSLQYAVQALRLPQAHQVARGQSVVIAVIDSAIDPAHPEIAGALTRTIDVTGVDGPSRPHQHGTGMAGAIVAHAQLLGAAPAAAIVGVTAFRPEGQGAAGTTVSLLRAFDAALAENAKIVNMSFAGPRDPLLSQALARLRARGIVAIAAAGNAGPKSPPLFPAADPNVIAVTATDADDRLFGQANRGSHIAVAAPGVDVLVPGPGNTYEFTSGTSVAAAHVSGVAALLLERDPTLGPDAVRQALLAGARDLGPRGRDDQFGAGAADAFAVLQAAPRRDAPTAAAAPAQAGQPLR